MNQDDIIKLAREAGGCDISSHGWTSWVGTQSTDFLERFAARVAAAAKAEENEACAKVCESRQTPGTGSVAILNGAADAIRARGNP